MGGEVEGRVGRDLGVDWVAVEATSHEAGEKRSRKGEASIDLLAKMHFVKLILILKFISDYN